MLDLRPRRWATLAGLLVLAGCGGSGGPGGSSTPPPVPIATVTDLDQVPPDSFSLAFLLTDGTVMVQGDAVANTGAAGSVWYQLTPDALGSHVYRTWSQMASLSYRYVPYDFTSAVLADRRYAIVGGVDIPCGCSLT